MSSLSSIQRRAVIWTALAWSGWWALPICLLAGHWETNPQYSYGWLVPILTLTLAWRRWRTRPEPDPPARWALPLVVVALVLVAPSWVVGQANPGWRLIPSLLALCAVAGTIGLAGRLGGSSWARHFSFPAAFLLTAVPWPGRLEEDIIQGLMKGVAGATVVLLNLFGIAAAQRGNLVEIAAGTLGVDEACSGVRSLQAALMASLFLGEFYRLKPGARTILVVAGFVAAMITNVARTSFLSFSAARQGIGAVSQWHDPAGYTVLTFCLVIIALLAQRLPVDVAAARRPASPSLPALPPGHWGMLIIAWLAVVFAGTEVWYYRPPAPMGESWTVVSPAGANKEALPEKSRDILGCDRDRVASWQGEDGTRWSMFFLEWEPSRSRTALLARVHRPEICLTGVGLTESGPRTRMNVSAAGFDLTFQVLEFRDPSGATVFVFFCTWEIAPGQPGRNTTFDDDTRAASLRRVWERERLLGQQSAEFIVFGVASREAAEAAMRAQVGTLIQPEQGTLRPF